MTDLVDVTVWPSHALATCAMCGVGVQGGVEAGQRFYSCGCKGLLIDADELDAVVIKAVMEHQISRMVRQSFRPRWIQAAWRYADGTARRAMIVTELAGATIAHNNGRGLRLLSCMWHTDDPDIRCGPSTSTPPRSDVESER